MRMAAIYNRRPERARRRLPLLRPRGRRPWPARQAEFDDAVRRGIPVVAEDPFLICRSPEIDVVVDVTGSVEFGAHVILEAFRHGKSVVLMNAEVDATIGPILQVYATQARRDPVGLRRRRARPADEPRTAGSRAWASSRASSGNVKGLQDPYRNPTTQQGWAERWGQNAAMVTSFADGSKISFEQSIVANATGFKVRSRGMSRGLKYDGSIMDIHKLYDLDEAARARRHRRLHGRSRRA